MMLAQTTVFIIADDGAERDALVRLAASERFRAKGFPSVRAFIDTHEPARPGCLVADADMPEMSGVDLQQMLKTQGDGIPVILISGHGDVSMAVRSLKMGARDFIAKPFHPQELLDSIRLAVQEDAETWRRDLRQNEMLERLARLSEREKEVLDLVMAGAPNKQIAARLEIAERTVEDHRSHIMKKVVATSLPDLVKLVLRCRGEPDAAWSSHPLSLSQGPTRIAETRLAKSPS